MSINAADFKGRQFTSTVVGTNHGDRVPDNMVRELYFIKYNNAAKSGAMSSTVTLYESNAAGTSTRILDEQFLNPGDTVQIPNGTPNENLPVATLTSGNSYIRSVVSDSVSGQIGVTTMERDVYA